MLKKDKQRHLRHLVCEGCSRRCRYADFRAFGRYAGGFAPRWKEDSKERYKRRLELAAARARGEELPHGNTGKRHIGQQEFAIVAREAVATNGTSVPVSTGTVLGRLYRTKMELWRHFTENCPAYGEDDDT